jgi:hypothetical protein
MDLHMFGLTDLNEDKAFLDHFLSINKNMNKDMAFLEHFFYL